MSQGNGTTVSGLGTANNNGNTVDDKSNVQVDFVWGNFPMQPNDDRSDTPVVSGQINPSTLLDLAASNHINAESGWGGFPYFDAGTKNSFGFYQGASGSDVTTAGLDYIKVPSVLGKTTLNAIDALEDAGFVKLLADITRVNATSANSANIYAFNADVNYPLNSKITITAGKAAASSPVAVPAYVLGEWTVTAKATGYVTITGSGFTVADTSGINATGNIKAARGPVNTITTATATTNTAKTITAISRTAGNAEVSITATGAVAAYPIGTKITIGASTGIPTELVNTWTVTGNSSTNVVKFTGTLTTVLALTTTELTGSASLTGATGTINAQTVAAGAATTAPGTAITITPWA